VAGWLRLALCAAVAGAATPGTAAADTIVQTWDTGQNQTDVDLTHTFNQFDPSLGTLTGVMITLSGTTERDILFQNLSPSSGATLVVAAGNWTTQYSLTGPDGTSLSGTDSNNRIALTTQAWGHEGPTTAVDNGNGTTTIAGTTFTNQHLAIVSGGPSVYGDVATYYALTSIPTQSETLTSGLGTFLGTSTFMTNTSLGYSASGGNNYTAFNTFADATVTVTYDYSPVPLPAAAWLLGSGVVGLVGLGRRRRTAPPVRA
jgi:hypothetical protein